MQKQTKGDKLMCCCGKPTINGEPGYSWDGKSFSTWPLTPPSLDEGDEILCDEPGRCGGLDAHSHHFRFVKTRWAKGVALLVRHGGGDERISLWDHCDGIRKALTALDSNGRYWLLHSLYSAHREATGAARETTNSTWRKAAAEKRIKTRKYPARGTIKVWIEDGERA